MNKQANLFACTSLGIAVILTLSTSAFASLGDNESSIDKDGQSMKAAHQKSQVPGQAYTVHTLTTSTVTVKEYLSTSGVVFAVSWRGAAKPDLSALLGSYYTEFSAASAKMEKGHGRHAINVKSAKVTVSSGGHMRDLHGKAFAPDLVPAGVNVETLQ